MSKNRVMGRLVSAREEPKSTLVTLSTRPQRVAFIIGQDFAAEELLRLIRYNTTIWGGIFNAFVPTDGTELVDGWWESLKTHDPDVVVWCGSVFPQFAQELEARLQPFRCISWQGLFVEDAPRIDHLNNVEMRSVLASVYDELQGKSAANVRIPVFDSDQPFSLFAAAQLGMLDEDYHRVYVKSLRASEVDFRECNSYASYFACALEVLQGQHPLLMTSRYLTPSILSVGVGGRVVLVLAGREPVQDLCAFWALRMTPGLGRAEVVFLPIDVFRSAKNLEHLAEWCNRSLARTNVLVVASASVNRRRLKSFRTRLHTLLCDEIEFVDLRVSHFTMGQFRVCHEAAQEELTWLERRTRLRRPLPAFDNQHLSNAAAWVLDLELENPAWRQRGFIPLNFPRLNHILNGRPSDCRLRISGFQLRKAHGVLSRRVSKSSEFTELKLPAEEDLFRELVDCAGYRPEVTDKCRLVTGMTKLMTSAYTTHWLREGLLRRSLRALARLGRSYDL